MRPTLWLSAALALLAGCASADTRPETSIAPTSGTLAPQPPIDGLAYDDPRLVPVLAELRAHPEWLDEPLDDAPSVLALVPGAEEVCLALRGSRAGDVFVTIEPDRPWRVSTVALNRGDSGRQITHDVTGSASDVCAHIVLGRREEWPDSAELVEVTGSVAGGEARAIARAIHADPASFGIDQRGIPSVLVLERISPAPGGWTCSDAGVFVGGPRVRIILGTRPSGAGTWDVSVRVIEHALQAQSPRPPGGC